MPEFVDIALEPSGLEDSKRIAVADLKKPQQAMGASEDQRFRAVGVIAHDFNNLLGVIIANLDLLSEQPASPQSGVLINEALEAALGGADLMSQLLAVADPTPARADDLPGAGIVSAFDADTQGSETILVVDDNLGMRRAVVRQLGEFGYRVIEAEDGPAALMILNSESIDLLFTDVVMPGGLSGYDLARLVLSRWPRMRAVITTGFPELEPQGDSASQAKLRRLLKPYRKADLARTLREVLDGVA